MTARKWTPARVSELLRDEVRWVDADTAMHCAECPTIFSPTGAAKCPRCGSAQAWRVGLVLDRRTA